MSIPTSRSPHFHILHLVISFIRCFLSPIGRQWITWSKIHPSLDKIFPQSVFSCFHILMSKSADSVFPWTLNPSNTVIFYSQRIFLKNRFIWLISIDNMSRGEMFQEYEEKRRKDGFFPQLYKAVCTSMGDENIDKLVIHLNIDTKVKCNH